jgi:flavorubredoxin
VEVAPETFVIQATWGEGNGPVAVHINSMVIRGSEPVVVDSGAPVHREQYFNDLFGLVEPKDVRWVFISHDDGDHVGNVNELMAACPNATLITTWFMCERLGLEGLAVPPFRWRWVGDGEKFEAGDRVLLAVRPPLYDSPTTRGLFDSTTGVYWASDCYAAPVERATLFADELDSAFWSEGFTAFQAWNSPWVSMVDGAAFGAVCSGIEQLGVTTIASCHGPTIRGPQVAEAFKLLRTLPTVDVPAQPGQLALDEIVAAMAAEAPSA